MIAKFTFNYNGGFEKKENAVFQQGSIGVDSYQVFAPFLTTTQVYVKTKRNGDLDFSLWKQLDYNSTIGGWLKTATQDELLVDGELKVVFKFNNLVSQETSLWVRKGTLIVPELTTYEALRDYAESLDGRIDQLIAGETAVHHVQFNDTLVDGDVTDKPSIMYDSYEEMFRAINDDDTDIVIGGELQKLVRNENSEDLAEGRIVAISGAVGQRVTIDTFDISSESEHSRIPAVITKSGVIALHGIGKVSFFGEIKGLPIANFESTGTAYAEGQPLYCSINSKITNIVPAKPNLHVHIGTLERIVGTTANVFIHTLVIPHFSHLSDVEVTTPQEGDIYVKTGNKVVNSQRLVLAESEITKIKDGTTVVKKAEQDASGNVITTTYETKADATSKKSELDGEILSLDERVTDLEESTTSIYDYKGSLLFENLPTTGQVTGDTYNILNDFTLGGESYLAGTDVAWNGSAWNPLGSHIPNGDEVQYSLGVSVNEKIDSKVDKTSIVDNLTTDDATKVLSAKQGKALQDTKEALANKAVDFSVIDDTKYPTTKAVSERLLNLPIAELNNHTLREVFEGGNLVVNGDFSDNSNWTYNPTAWVVGGGYALYQDVSTSGLIQNISLTINDDIYYTFKIDLFGSNAIISFESQTLSHIFQNKSYEFYYDTGKYSFNDKIAYTSSTFKIQGDMVSNDKFRLYEIYMINRTSLGLSALTVEQMDYWFSVYQALLVSDTNAIFSMFNNYALKTLETRIAPTLVNSWVGATVRYYKNNFGEIRLSGSITTGTIGTTAFTLPTGYRPSQIVRCPVESNGAFGYVIIDTDGTVVPTVGSNVRFSLDGVYFRGV